MANVIVVYYIGPKCLFHLIGIVSNSLKHK